MKKQFKELYNIYEDYIKIFNNWEYEKNDSIDFYNMSRLQRIFLDLTDILEKNNIIAKVGLKNYKYIAEEKEQ